MQHERNCIFTKGQTDVLDHDTSEIAIGGKLGIDATKKLPGEGFKRPCRRSSEWIRPSARKSARCSDGSASNAPGSYFSRVSLRSHQRRIARLMYIRFNSPVSTPSNSVGSFETPGNGKRTLSIILLSSLQIARSASFML